MTVTEARRRLASLEGWALAADGKAIRKLYVMSDFSSACALLSRIAEIADAADHHPDVRLTGYRKLELVLTTHSEGGLTEKDFDLAAKIESLVIGRTEASAKSTSKR